jgi:Heparinase II/III-like protein/Alginate lyase
MRIGPVTIGIMRWKLSLGRCSAVGIAGVWFAMACSGQDLPKRAAIMLPNPQPYPSIACTVEELARLREAYQGSGPAHDVVARRISQANQALKSEVLFPPEGGQHNQWYQCDQCQLPLKTIDATHHRCPKCGRVYSGYPYDNVIYSREHHRLTRNMWLCAWAYALTRDERYAQRAREILIGYAERYTKYPYHSANMGKMSDRPSSSGGHVFEQTLDEASWMREVCEAYDLIRLSPLLTPEDHRAIREDLLLPVYQNIAKHKAGKSNWQTYHNAAFMMIGGVLNRADLVRQAIEDKENGFDFQMRASVLPGGMWFENSWGYHFYTLGAVERIVETARRLGLDLYSTPRVKEMFTVPLEYRMADGTLPRFGDATTTHIPGGLYEAAYHHWQDPAFLALLPNAPTWDSVLYGRTGKPIKEAAPLHSVLEPGAGYAILRAGSSTAAFTFGPFGGFHGHFDKLSFVYFSQGKELGYDPGRARSQAYRLPVHKNWYRATISHNTVLVDRVSQKGAAGQPELFVSTPDLSAAAAHADRVYPGVLHRRLLVLRPVFLIVADVLSATDGKTHTFDWLYHNRGEGISCSAAAQQATAPEGQGFEYLKEVRRGEADGPIQAKVTMGSDQVRVCVNGQAHSEVLVGSGVGESVLDRAPVLMVTRRGQSACFAAAIELATKDHPAEVAGVEIEDEKTGGYLIRVRLRDQGEELYAYDPAGTKRMVAEVQTDSKLLCLRREHQQSFHVFAEAEQAGRGPEEPGQDHARK